MAHKLALKQDSQGFILLRDGKPVKTPAQKNLRVPNQRAADALMQEWAALGKEKIDPLKLPLTGFAALAVDVIGAQRAVLTEELLEFGETDLLFYQEPDDFALRRKQERKWQPWLEWAVQRFGTSYQVTHGLKAVEQDPRNRDLHEAAIAALDIWQLAGLMVAVKCSGSLLLGLAFMEGRLDADMLYELSRLEEEHNRERWGDDAEAVGRAELMHAELQNAGRWRDLLLTDPAVAAT